MPTFFEFHIEGKGRRINVTELVEQSKSLRTMRTALEEIYRREYPDEFEQAAQAHAAAEQYAIAGLKDLERWFLPEKLHAIEQLMETQRESAEIALELNQASNYEAFTPIAERIVKEQEELFASLRQSTPAEPGPHTRAVHAETLETAAGRKRPPPPPTDPVTKARLAEAARLHFPTAAERRADVEAMRASEKKNRITKTSSPSRQELKDILREGKPDKVAELARQGLQALEGYVHEKILRLNQVAVGELRARIRAANPDVLVAVERGGWFLTDVVTRFEPGLKDKVSRVGKVENNEPAHYAQIRAHTETLMLEQGKRRIAVVDAYMGGFNAPALIKNVFEPLLNKHAKTMGRLRFGSYWLREAAGFELEGGHLRPATYHASGPYADRIEAEAVTVPWIFGDDVNMIVNSGKSEPIRIFNSDGDVIDVIYPKPGESTYDLAIRLLNGQEE